MTDTTNQPPSHSPEPWLDDLFENHPDALLLLAQDKTIQRANPAAGRLFGIKHPELRGVPIRDLIPPDMAEKWDRDIVKLMTGDWAFLETFAAAQHRQPTPIAMHAIHLGAKNGPALILHAHDLSIYRNIERALQASSSQWDQSFDAITDCLCVLDRNGLILRANRAMIERFGASVKKLTGLDYRVLLEIMECTGPNRQYPHAVHQAPFSLEPVCLPAQPGFFSLKAYPLQREDGNVSGALLVIRDITEAHVTREALNRTEASLYRAAKMEAIGRLAGGVAHDFNNILTTILGYSSMALRNLPPDNPVRNDIREIIAASERASTLTQQLLDFSHDRAIDMQIVNINDLLRNMERFLLRTLGEQMQLNVSLHPALWLVKADVSRLEQVIMNLVVNARDAMPKGGVLSITTSNTIIDKVFCETRPETPPGEYLKIEVSDTGHGMTTEVLSHIFEPFFTTKSNSHGSGIGLSIVYGIIRKFNGCILCHSEINKGATFTIYLPRASGVADLKQKSTFMANEFAAVPRGSERILVVDDEPNIAQIIAYILGDSGYKVLSASNGAEAIAAFNKINGQLDLLIADIGMPDISGPELYQKLRGRQPRLKALFMSGYATPLDLDQVAGKAAAFIQKPFNFATLGSRIREILANGVAAPPSDTSERTSK